MPGEDKTFDDSLVLDFRTCWRQVTIYRYGLRYSHDMTHPYMEGNGIISTEEVPCLLIFPLSYGVGHPQAERKSKSILRWCMTIYDIQVQNLCRYFVLV